MKRSAWSVAHFLQKFYFPLLHTTNRLIIRNICDRGEFQKIGACSHDDAWLINDRLEKSRRKCPSASTEEHRKVPNVLFEDRKTVAKMRLLWSRNRYNQAIKPHSTFDNNHLTHIEQLKSPIFANFWCFLSHIMLFFNFYLLRLVMSKSCSWEYEGVLAVKPLFFRFISLLHPYSFIISSSPLSHHLFPQQKKRSLSVGTILSLW